VLSPDEWVNLLAKRLDERWTRMAVFDAYFEGDHRIAFATAKWREAFGLLLGEAVDNWCPLVVEATAERLQVQGFRFGSGEDADAAAWGIWQANGLDAAADQLHTEAIKLGESAWLVEPPAAGSSDPPRITAEHPSQVIVATDPGDRRVRLAALKRWWDDDGYVYATLYLPQEIVKFRSAAKARAGLSVRWERRPGDPGGPNVLGVVPVIPAPNAPTMLGGGQSDLADCIPIQDALNKLMCDMLISSEYMAYPQRVLLGVEVPLDPVTGQPKQAAQVAFSQSRLLVVENEGAKIDEFSAADLNKYVEARSHLVQGLTAKTRTPPHYVIGQIVNASGDALKAAETGLVKKTTRKMPAFGDAHEDMMRLAFLALGDSARASALDAETLWRNPESRSQAELADSLVKLKSIGVPDRFLWEEYGFSPQQIDRMLAAQDEQALIDGFAAQPDDGPQVEGVSSASE
jgi:hypothetical protein